MRKISLFLSIAFAMVCALHTQAPAAIINIAPANYGTISYGGSVVEATNNDPCCGPQPFNNYISLNTYAGSQAVVTFDTSMATISYNLQPYYYLDLNGVSIWSGVDPTENIDLYFSQGDGLVTRSDYNQGQYFGTFLLNRGNSEMGDVIGRTYVDISDPLLSMVAANVKNVEFYIRNADNYSSGILFSSPNIIGSSDALYQPVSAVPVPAALPLFAMGLLGLLGYKKFKNI